MARGPLVTFASLVLATALLVAAAILATSSPAAPPCTHGVSSAGPVVIVNDKLVANPKPHTEVCGRG